MTTAPAEREQGEVSGPGDRGKPSPRPTHVLTLLHDLRFGGDETRTLSFAREVDPSRIRHTVVTVNRPGLRARPELWEHYAAAGITVLDLGSEDGRAQAEFHDRSRSRVQRAASLLRATRKGIGLVRRLRALVLEQEVEVIDAHGELPGFVAVVVGRLTGVPVAVTSYHLEGRADSRVMWLVGQVTWGWADTLISDSAFAVDLMRRWTWRQPRRLAVVRNGVRRPDTGTTRAQARRRLGVPEDAGTVVIGQIGRLHPLKGHRHVLDAMPAVLARHPEARLVFVGFAQDPSYVEELWHLARSRGVDHRLTIAGHAGDIGDVWPAVDVQVHASLLESLPIAIAEGMSLGKPAVVTDVAGTAEEVAHGRTGLVVPPGDPAALAAGLVSLLDDPALAARLGAAAAERYLQMFRPEVAARHLEDIFTEMADQVRRAAAPAGGAGAG